VGQATVGVLVDLLLLLQLLDVPLGQNEAWLPGGVVMEWPKADRGGGGSHWLTTINEYCLTPYRPEGDKHTCPPAHLSSCLPSSSWSSDMRLSRGRGSPLGVAPPPLTRL
jgi:hypothetical protein